MISIHRFNYAGYSSEDFDLCCELSFDESSGETSTFLSREAVASETYRGEIQRVSSYKYTDVLAPTMTFTDKNFGEFDLDRQRRILRWLTSKCTPSFITIYHDDSNVVSYEILGAFTEINTYKNGSGRVIGFTTVLKSISPFAYSELQTITKDVSDPSTNTFTIDVDSDNDESTTYPRITIQQHNSVIVKVNRRMITNNQWVVDDWMDGTVYYCEDYDEYYYNHHYEDGTVIPTSIQGVQPSLSTTSVIIKNTYIDQNGNSQEATLKIANNVVDEKIVLDGANKVVSSSSTRIFGDDFINWSWLPLYNGVNNIEVIGNCTVTLEYRTVVKCGEF